MSTTSMILVLCLAAFAVFIIPGMIWLIMEAIDAPFVDEDDGFGGDYR